MTRAFIEVMLGAALLFGFIAAAGLIGDAISDLMFSAEIHQPQKEH